MFFNYHYCISSARQVAPEQLGDFRVVQSELAVWSSIQLTSLVLPFDEAVQSDRHAYQALVSEIFSRDIYTIQ